MIDDDRRRRRLVPADLHARRRLADLVGVVDDRRRQPQHAVLDRVQRRQVDARIGGRQTRDDIPARDRAPVQIVARVAHTRKICVAIGRRRYDRCVARTDLDDVDDRILDLLVERRPPLGQRDRAPRSASPRPRPSAASTGSSEIRRHHAATRPILDHATLGGTSRRSSSCASPPAPRSTTSTQAVAGPARAGRVVHARRRPRRPGPRSASPTSTTSSA